MKRLEVTIHKVEVEPIEEPRYTSKWFPFWFCGLVNRITGRRLIGKYRLSDWRLEKSEDIEIFHGIDLEKELIDTLTKEKEK